MIDTDMEPTGSDKDKPGKMSSERSTVPRERKTSKSMHDGIAVWCDCCSCEAEPYWVAVAEETGFDLGSDYEEPDIASPKDR